MSSAITLGPQQTPRATNTSPSGTVALGLPVLLFGARMWAATCLALFLGFWMQLDDPSWAATTAVIICQPAVGAVLRKGWYRLIGTVIGASAAVVLTISFPQSRVGFMIALAVWGGLTATAASLLQNFASYAAALAGYTASIIAVATLGQTGGPSSEVFLLAIHRATEISLGIVCASLVMAVTEPGGARQRFGTLLAGFADEIARGMVSAFQPGGNADAGRASRRDLLRRATGLPAALDQGTGEISGVTWRPRVLRAATESLYAAASAWRAIATHLERHPEFAADGRADAIVEQLPPELFQGDWRCDPARRRQALEAAARRLVALRTTSSSIRLLADQCAGALLALSRALAGTVSVQVPGAPARTGVASRTHTPDLLPPVLGGVRAFVTIAVTELIWVHTAWSSGGNMVMFAAITVILFAPREDAAYQLAFLFGVGTIISAVLAAVVLFAVLPSQSTFGGLCLALGVVLVPIGGMSGQTWQQLLFMAMGINFLATLGPANQMTYNPATFYNNTVGIVAGVIVALMFISLIPPISPALRARRLLTLSLRDLRRLAAGRLLLTIPEWEQRINARLASMPASADPLQYGRLLAGLDIGSELLRLRGLTDRVGTRPELQPVLDAIARGDIGAAADALARLDAVLGTPDGDPRREHLRLRAGAGTMVVAEALSVHRPYFEAAIRA